MHPKSNRCCHEEDLEGWIAHHNQLKVQFGQQHNEEPPVMVNGFEDVELRVILAANLAAVDLVE